jgi:hypothetical protein
MFRVVPALFAIIILRRETDFVKQPEGRACFTDLMMWNFGA